MSRKRRHPGTVRSDRQAFRQIAARFRQELGLLLHGIDFVAGPVPFWALIRIMFPVAESLGDLIYRRDSTAQNLRLVLEREFEQVRSGYREKAALLTLLYRHSLMHQDELRLVTSAGKGIGWKLSGNEDHDHLQVSRARSGTLRIEFQPRSFAADILAVCESAQRRRWAGQVMKRYNGWMGYDLDAVALNSTVKAAKIELAKI